MTSLLFFLLGAAITFWNVRRTRELQAQTESSAKGERLRMVLQFRRSVDLLASELLFAITGGQNPKAEDYELYYYRRCAREAFEAADFARLERNAANWCEREPDNATALFLLGSAEYGRALEGGYYDVVTNAIKHCDDAIGLDASKSDVWAVRGKAKYLKARMGQRGEYAGAVHDLAQALHLEPDNPSLRFSLGRALLLTGQYTKAIAELSKYLEHDRMNSEVYRIRSSAYRGNKDAGNVHLDELRADVLDGHWRARYIAFGGWTALAGTLLTTMIFVADAIVKGYAFSEWGLITGIVVIYGIMISGRGCPDGEREDMGGIEPPTLPRYEYYSRHSLMDWIPPWKPIVFFET
jgi:tetratricopeptide (TPR) repeat protein